MRGGKPRKGKYEYFTGIRKENPVCDGGMGSLLQQAGLKPGELPGVWNMTHPEVLVQIHRDYLEAGADIVTTNTFGGGSAEI